MTLLHMHFYMTVRQIGLIQWFVETAADTPGILETYRNEIDDMAVILYRARLAAEAEAVYNMSDSDTLSLVRATEGA